jgi:hypothetical protein
MMHTLSNDRMKWGWWAFLAGLALGGINLSFALAPRNEPHAVRTRAEAIRLVEARLHRQVCATHLPSGPLVGIWHLPLMDGLGPRTLQSHPAAAVDAETGRIVPPANLCTSVNNTLKWCKPVEAPPLPPPQRESN